MYRIRTIRKLSLINSHKTSLCNQIINSNHRYALSVLNHSSIKPFSTFPSTSTPTAATVDKKDFANEINSTTTASNSTLHVSSSSSSSSIPLSKPRLRIHDILNSFTTRKIITISNKATVDEAISHLVENGISAALVLDETGEIAGMFTARDILRFMHTSSTRTGSHNNTSGKEKTLLSKVEEFMVYKNKLLFCSPNDTVRQARSMMSQSKVRHLPVIENNEILGIISSNDLADSAFSVMDLGGKKGFIQNVTGRKGVPEGTKIRKAYLDNDSNNGNGNNNITGSSSLHSHVQLEIEVGSYALPHPYKKTHSVGGSRRDYGAYDLCNDMSLCEDAHFTLFVDGPPSKSATTSSDSGVSASGGTTTAVTTSSNNTNKQLYMCIADGVGSWRQYGVDPRQFSHNLVKNALKTIEIDAEHRASLRKYPLSEIEQGLGGIGVDSDPIRPFDIMVDAWNMTVMDRINGSSTFCIATVDTQTNQLSYSNLGDCGLVIIRHIDSETAGYMRERQLPRYLRKNDLRIAYLAQQQLRSFNLPYQLGYFAGGPGGSAYQQHDGTNNNATNNTNNTTTIEHKGRFETPMDADTAAIPIMPGDIILLATDGLFDNIDLDEIVTHVSDWESKWFSVDGEDMKTPSAKGDAAIKALAKSLAHTARERSLDTHWDSPFAVLAKENDIMWGGGMPDDTSIIVARIMKASPTPSSSQ